MTARSRDFKMKVYPSIGYLFVYVAVIVMNNRNLSLQEISEQHQAGKMIIISSLYFSSILLTMAINQIIYSEKYKASWFYYITPIDKPGEIIMGAAKAAILKFYIPIVFVITIAGLVLVGTSVILNIALGLLNQLLISTILVYLGNKLFPFSVHENTSVKTGSFIRTMSILFISVCIAMGHYFIYDIKSVLLIGIILSFIATWMMMNSIKQTSWKAIKSSYED
jgi:ABC-2 type transport system permease protein